MKRLQMKMKSIGMTMTPLMTKNRLKFELTQNQASLPQAQALLLGLFFVY